jgi:uncharacterized protein YjbI with pentapeptide repeats
MANARQVELIKKGPEAWNEWREQNPDEAIDLSEADLRGITLSEVNLKEANLKQAKLQFSNLAGASLEGANLEAARLQEVNLQGAQLENANLKKCNLMESNLQGTNLQNADVQSAQFNEDVMFGKTNLKGANLLDASGLSVMQIQISLVDKDTKLPEYLNDDMEDEDFINSMI